MWLKVSVVADVFKGFLPRASSHLWLCHATPHIPSTPTGSLFTIYDLRGVYEQMPFKGDKQMLLSLPCSHSDRTCCSVVHFQHYQSWQLPHGCVSTYFFLIDSKQNNESTEQIQQETMLLFRLFYLQTCSLQTNILEEISGKNK